MGHLIADLIICAGSKRVQYEAVRAEGTGKVMMNIF